MSARDVGAVIAHKDGWFAGFCSQLAPRYDGDDESCITVPSYTTNPARAYIYTSVRSAERALDGRALYCAAAFDGLVVVPLVEVDAPCDAPEIDDDSDPWCLCCGRDSRGPGDITDGNCPECRALPRDATGHAITLSDEP